VIDPSMVPHADEGEVDIWSAPIVLLRKRRIMVRVFAAALVLGTLFLVFTAGPPTYSSDASFIRQSNSPGQRFGLSGLAGQFGLSLPGGGDAETASYYSDLLLSRRLLAPVARTEYDIATDSGPVRQTYVQFVAPLEKDSALAEEAAIMSLRANIGPSVALKTGVISYFVAAPQPLLAYQIADRLLRELNDFNTNTRQGKASAEREFVEGRLAIYKRELAQTESELQAFLARNRTFQSSPDLVFTYNRLNRDLTQRQEIVNTLTQSLEQARIEEMRNTAIITVVDQPRIPATSNPSHLLRNALLLVLLAGVAGVAAAFLAAFLERSRDTRSDSHGKFKAMLTEARRDWFGIVRRKGA